MTLSQVRALIPVADEEMLPLPGVFLHPSTLHGQAHVGRVMIHALRLIEATGWLDEAPRLWASVYLHDIGRVNDGSVPRHGADSWARLASLPEVRALFRRGGVRDEDLPAIQTAVSRHSHGEAREGEPHERLIKLLKDADGLDRVRLWDLDPRCLRCDAARKMVRFAEALYEETNRRCPTGPGHFAKIWKETLRLLAEPDVR